MVEQSDARGAAENVFGKWNDHSGGPVIADVEAVQKGPGRDACQWLTNYDLIERSTIHARFFGRVNA